jgi:homoserine dehydrogenase
MSERTIRVGMLGCGTVGAAVIRLLHEHADDIVRRAGCGIEVARVAVLDADRPRDVPVPRDAFTTDLVSIVDDPGIDVVCELIGGIDPARAISLRALANGKPVVTANKELLATDGQELFEAADAASVDLLFEASVAGGVPLIRPLKESLAGERVSRLLGIVNGTTNFILTQMSEHGWSFEESLLEAKRLGYATTSSGRASPASPPRTSRTPGAWATS